MSSVAPSAWPLEAASSASARIWTQARTALPRPQASVRHLLVGSGGAGGASVSGWDAVCVCGYHLSCTLVVQPPTTCVQWEAGGGVVYWSVLF